MGSLLLYCCLISYAGEMAPLDGSVGTSVHACTAIGAGIRINRINISGGDSSNRAFVNAGATCYASIRINFVCHKM